MSHIPVNLDQISFCVLRPGGESSIGYCFTAGQWIVHKPATDSENDETWAAIRKQTKGRWIFWGQLMFDPLKLQSAKKSYRGKSGLCIKLTFAEGEKCDIRQINRETLEKQYETLQTLVADLKAK